MRHLRHAGATLALAAFLVAQPATAQETPPDPVSLAPDAGALESAVLSHAESGEATRQDLMEFLESDAVRHVAEERGLSMERIRGSAATLSDRQVQATAPLLERAMEAVQSGGTITISVYTVIIILLLLILLT